MITFFNKIGNSWIAKIICATLAISMAAFWGLGGLTSSFSGNDHKAVTVGSSVITIDTINQQLNQERGKISALTGQDMSVQKAIEAGLLDRIVQQLIREKVLENIYEKIGLAASDAAVSKYIERNPLFQDNLGNFDSNLFYAYMGQLKMNQAQLSEKLRQELTQKHLSDALSKTTSKNSPVVDLIASLQKEKRDISAVFLDLKGVEVGTPDEDTLKDYYEAYQEEFMTPEYRKVHLLTILPAHFKGEKEQAYDKMYKSVQDLEDLLGEGVSLKEAAQKLNLSTPTVLTTSINGLDQNSTPIDSRLEKNPILQEIFTLSEGEASGITDYENGFLVAEVEKIFPVSLKPYDTVKGQVKALWKTEQQKEKLPELAEKVKNQVIKANGWGAYYPIHEVIEQNQAKKIPLELLAALYSQKTGYENAQSYPVKNGTWIVVVNRVIKDKVSSQAEKDLAHNLYTNDLFNTLQQAYAKNMDVKVNDVVIKKFFSSYTTDEE